MRLLVRYFLRSFFLDEGLAPGSDPRAVVIAAAAICAAPGLLLCTYLGVFWITGERSTPDLAFLIALSMLLSGMLALLTWDRMLLQRSDFLVLGLLPIPAHRVIAAKVGALVLLVAGFIAITNGYSAFMFPLVATPKSASVVQVMRNMGAQWIAVAAASAWLFLLVLAVRGALAAFGSRFDAVARALRLWLMVALITALALTPDFVIAPAGFARLEQSGRVWTQPLFWFVGLERWLAGTASPVERACGHEAVGALILVGAAAAIGFGAACWRRARLPGSSPPAGTQRWRWTRARLPTFWPQPLPAGRAVLQFARITLRRSRRHGLGLSVWLGAGIALIAANLAMLAWSTPGASLEQMRIAALAAPLTLCFFLVLGLRHAMAMPVAIEANWVFRLAESGGQPERFGAAARVLWLYAAVPVLTLTFPFAIFLWDWRIAALDTAYCAALAGLLIEVTLIGTRKLPFACAYVPGRANFKLLWPVYWLLFTAYAYGAASLASRLLLRPWLWGVVIAGFAGLSLGLHFENRRRSRRALGAQFDDAPDPVVQTLLT